MTVTLEPPLSEAEPTPPAKEVDATPSNSAAEGAAVESTGAVSVLLVTLSALLAGLAVSWMAAGVFQGFLARLIALPAATLAAAIFWFAHRPGGRPVFAYAALPAALGLGALAAVTTPAAGDAGLLSLIREALTNGLLEPPVPFDPGWRFLLVVFSIIMTSAAAAVSLATGRPKLGVAVVTPVVFLTALAQPASATVVSAVLSFGLLAAAFAVAYGADLRAAGSTTGEFEFRRLIKGAGVLAALLGSLLLIGSLGLLLPEPQDKVTIPPQRPKVSPPVADRELFKVAADKPQVWRLGVLDGYDGEAFLTPPYDSTRFREVPAAGQIPEAEGALRPGATTVKTTFMVSDIAYRQLPLTANPVAVQRQNLALDYDPRTQTFRLPGGKPPPGTMYTIESPPLPTGAQMQAAPAASPKYREFLTVPPPPPEVQALLTAAPSNPFDRLQSLRNAYYAKVVAAGGGNPTPVPPSRVVEMLQGLDATPFEITAGEVLLARWAGVPARMGYGYFGGDKTDEPKVVSVRPRHGATWLEAHFEGIGWVPITGTPPKARASLSDEQKNKNSLVLPTDDLALVLFVPVRLTTIQFVFVVVRYYAIRVLPVMLLAGLALLFYPALLKALRTGRRRRWARDRGPLAKIIVSYAELRDLATDLNIGLVSQTPLEFLTEFEEDVEHRELAWLVTRATWGDMLRRTDEDDVRIAVDMSASVRRRLRRRQTLISRLTASAARASLRSPWEDALPNLWWSWSLRGALRRMVGRLGALPRVVRRPRQAVTA